MRIFPIEVLKLLRDGLILEDRLYLRERRLSPFETSQHVNETPMSYLDYNSPKEAFRLLRIPEGTSDNNTEIYTPYFKLARELRIQNLEFV